MVEELLAYALLWDVEIISDSEYNEYVDLLFLKNPNDDLLLKLEWNSSDKEKCILIISNHCNENLINYDIFGQYIFSKMQEIYFENRMSIQVFSEKSYALWKKFPDAIHQTEPFWTLCYADDSLSWGDENQTRRLYEEAFKFYHNT